MAGQWAGIETVQFVERDSFCQQVLAKNFPHIPIHDDIKTFSYKQPVDLITAGFPCQPFSVAGRQKGKDDDRYLWPELLRVIRETRPAWFIGENVTGLVAMELENILFDLERENYNFQSFIIPACAANAPHRRDRLWIIANAMCKRRCSRSNIVEQRLLQSHKKWNLKTLQSEWHELQPDTWSSYTAQDRFSFNAECSRGNDGIPNRLDRIKSLGNSIVPQVIYPIMKMIKLISEEE